MLKLRQIMVFGLLAIGCLCIDTVNAAVILNEYNAVRNDRWLDVDGLDESTATDTFFGRIEGNGGRWFEAIVVGTTAAPNETVDMRGWSFSWTSGEDGTGSFTLTNDPLLGQIHRGTLLTFFSQDAGGPNVLTNAPSYDPLGGDWWLNINVADAAFVASGSLSTGNDNWQVTIRDSADNVVFGPGGEGVGSLSGVNSREVGKLEMYDDADSNNTLVNWQAITALTGNYQDGTSSTFGAENLWSGGTLTQDLSVLRNVTAVPEPSSIAALAILATGAAYRRHNRKAK